MCLNQSICRILETKKTALVRRGKEDSKWKGDSAYWRYKGRRRSNEKGDLSGEKKGRMRQRRRLGEE